MCALHSSSRSVIQIPFLAGPHKQADETLFCCPVADHPRCLYTILAWFWCFTGGGSSLPHSSCRLKSRILNTDPGLLTMCTTYVLFPVRSDAPCTKDTIDPEARDILYADPGGGRSQYNLVRQAWILRTHPLLIYMRQKPVRLAR